ncbi:MAG: peptidoglycan editing factor PgeF [Alphaproteobacteria bacterium]|nr:peptidoglycan editing factor PgeF [Alphaproteobacteria bacterium]
MSIPPPYLTHPSLADAGIAHGFFTRHGGVSGGVYDSLNGGLGSRDDRQNVTANRKRAAAALGGDQDTICGLYQIHSGICHVANPDAPAFPEGDAIITNREGITCVILTADCVPVLFADPAAGVVGAAHAGWRGAVGGIIPATIDGLIRLGASRHHLTAVVGPAIQQHSYQVADDLRDQVLTTSPQAEGHFARDPQASSRWLFDLPGYVLGQLRDHGITAASTDDDTYSDSRFFSHRRATHEKAVDSGRLMSMIRLSSEK